MQSATAVTDPRTDQLNKRLIKEICNICTTLRHSITRMEKNKTSLDVASAQRGTFSGISLIFVLSVFFYHLLADFYSLTRSTFCKTNNIDHMYVFLLYTTYDKEQIEERKSLPQWDRHHITDYHFGRITAEQHRRTNV